MNSSWRSARLALGAVVAVALMTSGCSKGSTLRGTTSVAVKSALKSKNINYKGDVTCTGDSLPISCTSVTTDGRPIAAQLADSGNSHCALVVTVAGQPIYK